MIRNRIMGNILRDKLSEYFFIFHKFNTGKLLNYGVKEFPNFFKEPLLSINQMQLVYTWLHDMKALIRYEKLEYFNETVYT